MLKNLEIIATICGLIQAYLIMNNKKENWIFYNIQMIALLAFSFLVNLWGDVLENAIYVILGIIGTTVWYSSGINFFKKIEKLTLKNRIYTLIAILLFTLVLYKILLRTNDSLPFLDSMTTILGLVATVLMIMKKIEAWILWMIDDVLMAVVYFMIPEQPMYLFILNIVWIFFAIKSYKNWRKIMMSSI